MVAIGSQQSDIIMSEGSKVFSDKQVADNKQKKLMNLNTKYLMVGDPCYQAHRCLDYEIQFNN